MMMVLTISGFLALAVWLYLLLAHHGFWRSGPYLARGGDGLSAWPPVLVVIPARDEAPVIERAVGSLLKQDYPGKLDIIVVDDGSTDGTGDLVDALMADARPNRKLHKIKACERPKGWSGKLWAIHGGIEHAETNGLVAPCLLLTDADIAHDSASLSALVEKMVNDDRDLVSLMVRLRAVSFWERLLIPPFVFFFRMLYPFPAVSDPACKIAAAAGGCVLMNREAFEDAGGIFAIKGELIDDVALGRAIKKRPNGAGRIWLGLSLETVSLRAYDTLEPIWTMVARTADTQLGHTLWALLGTMLGLVLVYLLPPLLVLGSLLHQSVLLGALGMAAWIAMSIAFWPTLALCRQSPFWLPTLPIAALLYALMTISSAIHYRRGRGGLWKGRVFVE